ncbi:MULTISPECIES: pyridoxal phosphate-dependent aminotransferase [unclassified Schlesneria]|uniref:pyridoxal phosphate-dependent aminotransferase n=1 Tax=Schlesneria TaxID=656899 RepID=UPI0035A0F74C
MSDSWIADRMHQIDASGIRKVFDLAATMKDPINLSIGQPHFDTPDPVKKALISAVEGGKNVYSVTQGISPLREALQARVTAELGHADRQTFITSGTSGGLLLALSVLVNPGDEVIVFDPWFVMYKHLVTLAGGTCRVIDTYPDFTIDLNKVRDAITPKTKVILCNSPCNPTGHVATEEEMKGLAELAAEKNICLISDEIYRVFTYEQPFVSPAKWNDQTLVIDGFSKSHSMTGLRLGFAHGPSHLIQQMIKLQQFTFVCAPQPVQWAGLAAMSYDVSHHVADYAKKRLFLINELKDDYDIRGSGGAFYLFIKSPKGTGTEFTKRAIENGLLIIPGNVFSPHDTHFRVSFAAENETLARGVEVLKKLVRE